MVCVVDLEMDMDRATGVPAGIDGVEQRKAIGVRILYSAKDCALRHRRHRHLEPVADLVAVGVPGRHRNSGGARRYAHHRQRRAVDPHGRYVVV